MSPPSWGSFSPGWVVPVGRAPSASANGFPEERPGGVSGQASNPKDKQKIKKNSVGTVP